MILGEFNMRKNNDRFTFSTIQIAVLGVLIALGLVLSRTTIALGPSNQLSFGFIVNAIIGILYGPWVAGFAGMADDLLQSFLFGVQGTFFIGFTLTAFVGSFIYGWFLHRKNITWKHVFLSVLFNTVITNLIMNTLWIHILYQTPFVVLLASRIPQNLIMAPIRFIVIYLITKNTQMNRVFDRYATKRK